MATPDTERELLRRAREHLDGWTFEARDRAFAEFFEGPEAAVSSDELGLLDRIDSALTRQTGTGLWDADEYGILPTASLETEYPQVVCLYHPEIPGEGYRGEDSLDEATRSELNDVLWEYAERVAEHIQADFDAFLDETHHGLE